MYRKKDSFEVELAKKIEYRIRESKKNFEFGIKTIAAIVGESIKEEKYDINYIKYNFENALELCKDNATTYDAIYNLCNYVFKNYNCNVLRQNTLIKTIKRNWNKDYDEFRKQIKDVFFNSNDLDTEKGFIYIFWSKNPLKYFYVGKTDSGFLRFLERRHDSVVRASEKATKLTIIYLYPSKKTSIKEVEASIIRIIGMEDLEYNEKKEPFTRGKSNLYGKLSELKKFFKQLNEVSGKIII